MAPRFGSRSSSTDKAALLSWEAEEAALLNRRLLPTFFLLNDFLEKLSLVYRKAEIDLAGLDDETYADMGKVSDLDQQDIIESSDQCDTQTMIDTSAALQILLRLMIDKRIAYLVQSCRYPFSINKRILIYYGLSSFGSVLRAGLIIEERRQLLDQYIEDLWEGRGLEPLVHTARKLDSIYHLEPEQILKSNGTGTPRGHEVYNKFIIGQDIWTGRGTQRPEAKRCS